MDKLRSMFFMGLFVIFAIHGTADATMPTYVMNMSTLSATPSNGIKYGNIINFQATITGNEEVAATPGTPFPVRVVRYGQVRRGGSDWSSEEKIMNIPYPNQPLVTLTFTNGFPITAKGPFASQQNENICFILMQGPTQISPKACVTWAPAMIDPHAPLIPIPKPKIPVEPERMQQAPSRSINPGAVRGIEPKSELPARNINQLPQQNLQK